MPGGDRKLMDLVDRHRLQAHRPSPLLTEHYGRMSEENRNRKRLGPDAGFHNLPHFHMMRNVVRDALPHPAGRGSGALRTLVMGAKECNDIPLEVLAKAGEVYLIDVDPASMEAARDGLTRESLRKRVHTVCMDVSLFETALIEQVRELLPQKDLDPGKALTSVLGMHDRACEALTRGSDGCLLPIQGGGVNLAISTMTLSQFLTGYTNILLELFMERFGRKRVRAYFLPVEGAAGQGEGERDPVSVLQRSTLSLARHATKAHLRELARITGEEGSIVLSDHVLHGLGTFVSDDRVEVDTRSLLPYSRNREEDKVLQYRGFGREALPETICVELGRWDETFTAGGRDVLKAALCRFPQLAVCRHENWWWVTERANRVEHERTVWSLVFVDAYTLGKKQERHDD